MVARFWRHFITPLILDESITIFNRRFLFEKVEKHFLGLKIKQI